MNKLNKVFNRVEIISKYKKDIISVLELGTHKGEFAKELLNYFKPKKMVLVDPWKYETEHIYQKSWFGGSEMVFIGQSKQDKIYENVKNLFKKEIDEETIKIFRGNSDEFFKSNNVCFDLIYIDGNHLYDFIKKDLINSIKFINQNGLIVCDDYNSVGWWENGVTRAVNEILIKYNIELINYKEALITQQAVLKKNYKK